MYQQLSQNTEKTKRQTVEIKEVAILSAMDICGSVNFLRASSEETVQKVFFFYPSSRTLFINLNETSRSTIPWSIASLSHFNWPCRLSTLSQVFFSQYHLSISPSPDPNAMGWTPPKNQKAFLLQTVCKSSNMINFKIHLKINDNIVAKKPALVGLAPHITLGIFPMLPVLLNVFTWKMKNKRKAFHPLWSWHLKNIQDLWK